MERERIIEALKICDSNYDGVVCKKCPIKDEDYNGSWCDEDGDCYQHLMREAAELLSEQPTIQPERAKGEWSDGYRWQRCSLCKQTGKKSWNYCPNCGADMRGKQNEL